MGIFALFYQVKMRYTYALNVKGQAAQGHTTVNCQKLNKCTLH